MHHYITVSVMSSVVETIMSLSGT